MAESLQISPAEWDVMAIVWEAGSNTAAEVIARLEASHDWSHRTIRTLLARLVERALSNTRSTARPISIARPSHASSACARKAARS